MAFTCCCCLFEADSGRLSSDIYTGKKMAAREVGGRRGSKGQKGGWVGAGLGRGGVQVMHFDDSLQVKDE